MCTRLRNYATADVIDVGHVDQLLLLLQGIVGWHYLLSFCKGWSSVPYTKGDKKAFYLQHLENSTSSYNGCHFYLFTYKVSRKWVVCELFCVKLWRAVTSCNSPWHSRADIS